ncbi:Protein phosphatase methylesterase 1 [Morella rubra]|uniref:Protein phosphatase methylesterase 1 n=1 Tax=Morella rubra TaxID=262757 RepID=A0A6A1VFK7_9ROSI|nr:Protein phosphatase methylesterase 1 [Morella rubra]
MDSSNLTALPEEETSGSEEQQQDQQPFSAFASVPHRPPTQTSLQKYSPLDWSAYFDGEDDIRIPDTDNVFHVYMAGTEGPVVFCLHGGGYSGLSFALAASKIKEKARVVALDLRGHGKSVTDNDLDLSIETMCNDVLAILRAMYGDSPPAIVLVGHSMGGSVAVHVAAKKSLPSLAGLVVVDVVELMFSLKINKEIECSLKWGSSRNVESARVSIPSTLKYDDSKKCMKFANQSTEISYFRYEGLSDKFLSCPVPKVLLLAGTDRLDSLRWKYLVICPELSQSRKLSALFLDRALTIGQMQGKFQMVVVRHTGHAIQEDVPEEFATLILNFISRNHIGPRGIETDACSSSSKSSRVFCLRDKKFCNLQGFTYVSCVMRWGWASVFKASIPKLRGSLETHALLALLPHI